MKRVATPLTRHPGVLETDSLADLLSSQAVGPNVSTWALGTRMVQVTPPAVPRRGQEEGKEEGEEGEEAPPVLPWFGFLRGLKSANVAVVEEDGVALEVPTATVHRFVRSAPTIAVCALLGAPWVVPCPTSADRAPTVSRAYTVHTTVSMYASKGVFLDPAVREVVADAHTVAARVRARAMQLLRVFVGEAVAVSEGRAFPDLLAPHLRYIVHACFRHCSPASLGPRQGKLASLPALFHTTWASTLARVHGVWAPFSEADITAVTGFAGSLSAFADHVFYVDLRGLLDCSRDQVAKHLSLQCGVPSASIDKLLDCPDEKRDQLLDSLQGEYQDSAGMDARAFVVLYHQCRDPATTARRLKRGKKKKRKKKKKEAEAEAEAEDGEGAEETKGGGDDDDDEEEEEDDDEGGDDDEEGGDDRDDDDDGMEDVVAEEEGPGPGDAPGPAPGPAPAAPAVAAASDDEEAHEDADVALGLRLGKCFTLRWCLEGARFRTASGQAPCLVPNPALGPAALPLTRRIVGPVLRRALQRVTMLASTGTDPAVHDRARHLQRLVDAIPSGARTLSLEALFSTDHDTFRNVLRRYGELPATGWFTGGGLRFAVPRVKIFQMPAVEEGAAPGAPRFEWNNVDPRRGHPVYRAPPSGSGGPDRPWRTSVDWAMGVNGRYLLEVIPPRTPMPQGTPVIALDPGVGLPVCSSTGHFVYIEHWYRGRRWAAGLRRKPPDVKTAEAALSATLVRTASQLEYLCYLEARAEVRAGTVQPAWGVW